MAQQISQSTFRPTVLFLLALGILLVPAEMLAAEVYFGAHGQEVSVGKRFEVGVFVNTEGDNINALEGKIVFPPETELLDIRDGPSIVNFWVEKPSFTGNRVAFSGIIPGGYAGVGGFLFSMVLRSSVLGQLIIDVSELAVLRNDGTGSPVPIKVAPLSLQVAEQASTPEFLAPSDQDPPQPFTPEISQSPTLFDGKWFLAFVTQDKESGVGHYEVAEKRGAPSPDYAELRWEVVASPYVLKDQALRSHIYVKAVDRAGNEKVAYLPQRRPSREYGSYIIWSILLIGLVALYVFGRRVWGRYKA